MNNNFEDILRKKLAGHTETPPEDLWQEINAAMDAERKHRRLWIYYAAAGMVIALAMAAIWSLGKPETRQMASRATEETATKASLVAQNIPEPAAPSQPLPKKEKTPKTPSPLISLSAPNSPISPTIQTENETTPQEAPAAEEAHNSEESARQPRQPEAPAAPATRTNDFAHSSRKKAHDNQPLALNLYAANISSTNLSGASDDSFSPGDIFADPSGNPQPPISNDTPERVLVDKKHQQPLRVGLSLSYPLNPRLSLNAGLSLARLSSEITYRYGYALRTEKHRQTNIGLPLSATYRLVEYKPVSLYLTAGGMIEQCVTGEENRPQFSVFSGAGLQIALSPIISFYAEPLVSFYPDNSSGAVTIYKDKPTNLDLRLGIRMNLSK